MIDFDKLKPYKTKFGVFYDRRLIKELESLNDDDAITVEECGRILGVTYQRVWNIINESARCHRNGTWHCNLRERLITKRRYKLLKKSDIAEFFSFIEHKEILKEIRENKNAYKKAMQKKYGNVSFATTQCIKSNYDCEVCLNKNACSIANNEPFVKRLSYIMKILESKKFEPGIITKLEETEKENIKLKNEVIDLQTKILDLQKYILKLKKRIISEYEVENDRK